MTWKNHRESASIFNFGSDLKIRDTSPSLIDNWTIKTLCNATNRLYYENKTTKKARKSKNEDYEKTEFHLVSDFKLYEKNLFFVVVDNTLFEHRINTVICTSFGLAIAQSWFGP